MKPTLRSMLFALCAAGAVTFASAEPFNILETVVEVVEAPSSSVTLPNSIPGNLMMPACGTCALKNYPVTAATRFVLHGSEVTFTEFKAAMLGRDTLLGVGYRPKTGEIVSVRGP